MATQRWLGNAAPVAQVTTYTPAGAATGMTFSITCNGKTVSYTTSLGTAADACSGLAAAIAAFGQAEFQEFTPQAQPTYILLTGNTAGLPFTVTGAASGGGGGGSVTLASTTAATGPNDWANGANWASGSAPAASDDVYFDAGNVPCLYSLSQSAVTLDSLNVYQTYTGTIGLPLYNTKGGYREYRTQELTISATTVNIGQQTGNGSGRIKLAVGSNACTLNVYNTGQPADNGIPALTWRGTNSGNIVSVNKGSVGLATFPGDAATIATLNLGYVSNKTGDAQVFCGGGATITTVNQNGGQLQINNGATTIASNIGNVTIWSGAVGTLNANGGNCIYNSIGTLTTAEVSDGGTLDFSQDQRAKTVTNTINIYGDNASINDPFKVVSSVAIGLNSVESLANINVGETLILTRS
jgi:hypothetical protein